MAEDEAIFDPSLRNKKRKKKPIDMSALEYGSVPGIDGDMRTEDGLENRGECEKENRKEKDDDGNLDPDDFSRMKKKKKKKKPFSFDELENALPDAIEKVTTVMDDEREGGDAGGTDDILDFNLPKKKKKKKKKINIDELETKPEDDVKPAIEGDEIKVPTSVSSASLGGTERDYTYDELLQRLYNTMREKNPDMVAGEKKKFVLRPPQVFKIGTKKTSFANFFETCKILHRQPKHLQSFLLAELGTNGSVDANNQLIIKGRFQQNQIENVLRRYIKEYVTCHTCRSPETILQKDIRLYFLQCETCGSRCSVAIIKSGFQAVTGKRSANREKTD